MQLGVAVLPSGRVASSTSLGSNKVSRTKGSSAPTATRSWRRLDLPAPGSPAEQQVALRQGDRDLGAVLIHPTGAGFAQGAGVRWAARWSAASDAISAALLATGANPKEVAARAGHASVSFTLDRYGHLYPDGPDAARAPDAIWWPAEADRETSRPQRGPERTG
jgi:hypothetical protein